MLPTRIQAPCRRATSANGPVCGPGIGWAEARKPSSGPRNWRYSGSAIRRAPSAAARSASETAGRRCWLPRHHARRVGRPRQAGACGHRTRRRWSGYRPCRGRTAIGPPCRRRVDGRGASPATVTGWAAGSPSGPRPAAAPGCSRLPRERWRKVPSPAVVVRPTSRPGVPDESITAPATGRGAQAGSGGVLSTGQTGPAVAVPRSPAPSACEAPGAARRSPTMTSRMRRSTRGTRGRSS